MRVFIAGIDGYLGWPLALYLTARGHKVAGADYMLRRRWVNEMKSWSAIPIPNMKNRIQHFKKHFDTHLQFWKLDLRSYKMVEDMLRKFQPDTIVHLAECPSAAYSMIDAQHATFVQTNNITTTFNLLFAIHKTCPDAHLIKLGTMGEYGTPNIDIPEGFFDIEYRGRYDRLPFPRQASSWYHWSKVHGSNNVMFACKIWKLKATDIMQGIVFGTRIDEMGDNDQLLTRLDFDQAFGTILNRFCCQAVIGHPLTLYGTGTQRRGFISLRDSMECLALSIEHPPEAGEYRVFNQFQEIYQVSELASKVQKLAEKIGLETSIFNIEDPRQESECRYYKADRQRLIDFGYMCANDIEAELSIMIQDLSKYQDRIKAKKNVFVPDVWWNGQRKKVHSLDQHIKYVKSC